MRNTQNNQMFVYYIIVPTFHLGQTILILFNSKVIFFPVKWKKMEKGEFSKFSIVSIQRLG